MRWTRQATDDLRGIRRYISKDAPHRASLTADRITHATRRLETFPLLGRVVPERPDGRYREIIVAPYRVLYRTDGDTVEIATIVHGARQLPELPEA